MDRLKQLSKQYGQWKDLAIYIERIEYNLDSDFGAAIGNSKSLIECICKTILHEQENSEPRNDESINKLVKRTLEKLNIKNDSISQFANSIITASQKLGELRNRIDTSSHGQSLLIKNDKLEEITSYFLINCVENIACFLIDFYEIEYPRTKQTPDRKYIDYQDFNEYLDNLYVNIHMIGLSYSTSEILFLIDQVAYLDKYQEYLGEINETH